MNCQEMPRGDNDILDEVEFGSYAEERVVRRKFKNTSNFEEIKEFVAHLSQLSFTKLVKFKKFSNKGYIANNTNLKKFIFEAMNPCKEIFQACQWKGDNYDCCKAFYPIFTESGFCYGFNTRHYEKIIPGKNKELPGFNLKYIIETDLKWSLQFEVLESDDGVMFPVYIHNSDQIPGLDMQPQLIWDFKVERVAFSMKQTYTTDDTRQLSIKQRRCVFFDEIKLRIDRTYTYSACTRQCRMENANRFCGCVPHFYSEIEKFKHCKITELACIADHMEDIKSIERCSCQLECLNTVYQVEKLVVHNSDEGGSNARSLEVEFVSWPMVRYKREVLFGWVDLLVSFGGIAGLFLGFSLLSGVELIYYFTMRACCMIYREPRELERLQRQAIVKLEANYDLSLIPYFLKPPSPTNGIEVIAGNHYNDNLKLYAKQKIQPLNQKKNRSQERHSTTFWN